MKIGNERFYKGSSCKDCGEPITIKNKSGFCRKHKKIPKSVCLKISTSHLAEKNPMWKGDNAKLPAIHLWVKVRFPKTDLCQSCNKFPPRDLANISQLYSRELNDWEWLCRKCHMTKDGRLGNLRQFREKEKI